MLPAFPRSKKLELSDKHILQNVIHQFAPHSDFNFVGLWTYDTHEDLRWSYLNDNLVIKTRDYLTGEAFYSFIGTSQVIATISTMLTYAKKIGIIPCLKLIIEETVKSEDVSKYFIVEEDRDNFDYILSVEELVSYSGEKYHKHRKLMNKLHRLYPAIQPTLLDLTKEKTHRDIFSLFDRWAQSKGKNQNDTEHELVAIQRALHNHLFLKIVAVGLYHNNQLQSFFIFDSNHQHYAQSHFFKSNPEYSGATQHVRQFSAKVLQESGHSFINLEQDMGIEGLRIAKEQWNPSRYVKKYKIYAHS